MGRKPRSFSSWMRGVALVQGIVFSICVVTPANMSFAQNFSVSSLPKPGTVVNVSSAYTPVLLKGISLNANNPLVFDFVLATGDSKLGDAQLKSEGEKLVKYFLAALTVPEKDLWVNLSPYENDRIIPDMFGQTEMGRDLLAQDYLLKQLTASLIYPENDLGKDFWNRVYQKANQLYGTTRIPVGTFNKVWIVPDSAVIVESTGSAYVTQARLKVMLEEDFMALEGNRAKEIIGSKSVPTDDLKEINNVSSNIVREIILPEIEREVNEGKNFAQLRQVYYSLILATWFKNTLKDNIVNQVYANQNKVVGVDVDDPLIKEKIYQRYMQAYKQGAFNYIRKDVDQTTQEVIKRKYFSGGASFDGTTNVTQRVATTSPNVDRAMLSSVNQRDGAQRQLTVALATTAKDSGSIRTDRAMFSKASPAIVLSTLTGSVRRRILQDAVSIFNTNPSGPERLFSAQVIVSTPASERGSIPYTEALRELRNALENSGLSVPERESIALTLVRAGDDSSIAKEVLKEPLRFTSLAETKRMPIVVDTEKRRVVSNVVLNEGQVVSIFQALGAETPSTSGIKSIVVVPENMELPVPVLISKEGTLFVSNKQISQPINPNSRMSEFREVSVEQMQKPDGDSIIPLSTQQWIRENNNLQPVFIGGKTVPMIGANREQRENLSTALNKLAESQIQISGVTSVRVIPDRLLSETWGLMDTGVLLVSQRAVDNPRVLSQAPVRFDTDQGNQLVDTFENERVLPNFQHLEMRLSAMKAGELPINAIESNSDLGEFINAGLQSSYSPVRDSARRITVFFTSDQLNQMGVKVEPSQAVEQVVQQLDNPETAIPAALALRQSATAAPAEVGRLDQIIADNYGGIDFNPSQIKMKITKQNGGINVRFDPQVIEAIKNQGVAGFEPVILNIQPMSDVMHFLMPAASNSSGLRKITQ